ncbi:MAG: ribonuclease P protein component [Candidatus Moranbacteria bacterium]|nr:ribonuclease P protein component [Candidatus Moranbacteria bacterium]
MLKKSFRLRKKEDFTRVFRSGKPLFFKPFGCKLVQNDQLNDRLAFSFSKKHVKRAVMRNRLRRRISALYLKEEYNFKGKDIVFFTTEAVQKIEKSTLEAFLKKINDSVS